MLAHVTYGERRGNPPLLIAHGLFGSGRNWGAIAKQLARARLVRVVDMRNHGSSFRDASQTYPDMAGDLAKVIAEIGEPVDLLGHSMGGKAAMVTAVQHGDAVNRLIIGDISPVGYEHTQLPLIAAMRGVDLGAVKTRGDADAQLKKAVSEDGVRAFLLQSLDLTGEFPRWRLNLDALEENMVDIIGFPGLSGTFDGPTLSLAGGISDYVMREHRAQIKALFPKAKFAKIPGTGHWLHAEKPREFIAAVEGWLG